MLSSCLLKKPNYVNRSLAEYCRKSTEESIRKKTQKYNLERNKPFLNTTFAFNCDNNPDFNIYTFLLFLSISTISFYFYKRIH
jgi:hypothetical protein